ncbi:MAG: type IX secretion system membrane protein PorP/SprF [Cyclobacteriaceae bacterium]|nr:type IX secretion system membrane protein PorP/SprF [Cyclobacteriaceae bacterium]
MNHKSLDSYKRSSFFVFAFLLALVVEKANAQQYPIFSQYYFNELIINPAYAGSHVQTSINLTYRNQWVNFPGSPSTYSASTHTSVFNGKIGLGLLVNHDQIGSYSNQNLYSYYSYKIRFKKGTLSMGLQAGFDFLGVDFSKLDLKNPGDPSFVSINEIKANFGAGLYYSRKNYFIGFSVPFLINNAATASIENAVQQIRNARYYFLRGGVLLPINTDKSIKFNPSILVRAQEGQPLSFDFNAGFIFYDQVSAGLALRSGDAIISFIDFAINEKFHFTYSYDWTSSDLARFSNGSHEFMINYRFKATKGQKGWDCPHYYNYDVDETGKGSKNFNRVPQHKKQRKNRGR